MVFLTNLIETCFGKINQVHFIDGYNDMLDTQHGSDDRMTACLFQHTLTCIDQNDDRIGMAGAGDHISRVLNMTGRIGDNELPDRCGKISIGDIDRDALFPLSTKPVGQERQVDPSVCSSF